MPETNKGATAAEGDSTTKAMFDCLALLYKQGGLLLMDADRLMAEQGWEPTSTSGPMELSSSLNSPQRWYARWAARFYVPVEAQDEEAAVDRILFVSIHFASDYDTEVDEPIVAAGRLMYTEPMSLETAKKSYAYWMCKYWFRFPRLVTMEGCWHGWTGQGKFCANMKGAASFAQPLYHVTSSEILERLVIAPLFADDQHA